MKTIYYTATSLDGYIADPNHSLDWLFQFADSPGGDYEEFIANIGAIVMGSSTYEWLLRNEIFREGREPRPWPYSQPSWVFTTRKLREIPEADIRFAQGDVRVVYEEMQRVANGKNIWIVGGGELVGQFHDAGLLDELIVTVASVTLGEGAPLLPRRIVTPPLKLIAAERQTDGFAQLRYSVQR